MISIWGNIVVAILVIAVLLVVSRYFGLWLRAYVTGTRISILSLMMMSLRKVSPRVIVDCQVMAVQADCSGFPPMPSRPSTWRVATCSASFWH